MILYVETNFLMGIAKGQDPQAENLLRNTPSSVRLVIPSICFVEALTTLDQEEKYNQDFIRRLDIQINEAGRVQSDQNAKLIVNILKQSKVSLLDRINDIKQQFATAFNQLTSKAEMITLNPDILQESLARNILTKHTIDKLILECIIYHARSYPHEVKVFLSSNSKEFGQPEVTEILTNVNVEYFSKTKNFIGWLQSQSR
ncbi:PIN domain-containing protein [Iningainema tapete]|uniref:DUF4935 domain-containing protein n=1 Tax=Iningainema tapete BLCC-T55 TaxID=2748662 RepID=A0A8J7CDJ4_9CYAN|nr:hypothetical protein [Iningainema tapete BLCC-T55]